MTTNKTWPNVYTTIPTEEYERMRQKIDRLICVTVKAASQLDEVRDGTDFEAECWKVAQECRDALKGGE
jgi:hypothetical protein